MNLKRWMFFPIPFLLVGAALRGEIKFNRDVRPIMSDTCFQCHGPDANARMMDLRLDIREEALKPSEFTGKIPIVPGKPEESEIIARIFSEDEDRVMPPRFAHKELTAKQKEVLRQWVAEGAVYEGHWSFQPVQRPPVPSLGLHAAHARNPIDHFIQARLAAESLKPSPEADRRTLIRRVTLDLTGLPPVPTEVEAFVNDASPDAYEKLVERLLASPRFAEKLAIHWLDWVRYADTRGFHSDNEQPAWPYRDYVLAAFRDNKPFDQFTREQLAGDLLPDATTEQKVASAYNKILRTSAEGGIQDKEYLAKYGADRVRTTATVWLGLTMGCAECHDHKFDPVLTKDFYSLKAFFADLKEKGILPAGGPEAWGATLQLPSEKQSRKKVELEESLKEAGKALEEQTKTLEARQAEWEEKFRADIEAGRLKWRYQRPVTARSVNGAELTIYNDEEVESNIYMVTKGSATLETRRGPGNGLVVAGGLNPDNETYAISLKPGAGTWTALGVHAIQDENLPGNRQSRGWYGFVLSEVEAELSPDGKRPGRKLEFLLATTDGYAEAASRAAIGAIDGDPNTGWGGTGHDGTSPFLALRFAQPVTTDLSSVLTVYLRHDSPHRRATIGRLRLALSAGDHSWPELGDGAVDAGLEVDKNRLVKGGVENGVPRIVIEALKLAPDARSEEQKKALREHFQWSAPELAPALARVQTLKLERALLEEQIPKVFVSEAVEPRETRILPRGNWMDDSGEIVGPAIPEFLGKLETNGRRATRLDLANWIVSRQNPLTARAIVNRLWRFYFGTGLSKTLDDLGSQGEWPSHPELLDWLAAEFMEPSWQAEGAHAWDVKHLIRTIVMSHTYRQSSASAPQREERDPDNRLLARQSRFRVDAEVVRDVALAVSGLLVEKFGGPSVRPYQPAGYWAAMNFPKREYSEGRGEELYRRSVYTHWQRTFLHPTLATFDASSREECTVNRPTSNTPLQALVLLNDPIFVEAARVLAENILTNGGRTVDERLDWAFAQALGRKPTEVEREVLADLHRKSLAEFTSAPERARELIGVGEAPRDSGLPPAELAAMTTVARAVLNLHELITRN